ncbi:16S rRNA processing protein [Wigglesworthia glossinidia endosymbiont of Glossina morsitans morsitans (Yale colony)]|uniref:Ribosome maturation factor RimM n=1 Tax=Wigglesworthia glossinidia endosymbiont of Glossina morsitans morsitans (Yale colony) TaxID=1142511 RepID=H6Q567_WIGGL|nr:ribosome maturation factor RimM [Wigglesworthia glossinidia]AFA41350.1 16S rRNA processing protein [Wigglesworthia glossinidia endosymbiont of Glossina morsitans morsitans (Yale colony)]
MIHDILISIGKIGAPFGIKGWVKVISYTEKSQNIFKYQPWIFKINNIYQKCYVTSWKTYYKKFIAKIEAINNRCAASSITNLNVMLFQKQLNKLKNNEYYLHEIIGLQVLNTKNFNLGKVVNFLRSSHHDILVIRSQKKNHLRFKEYLIPFVYEVFIKKIDKNSKIIRVDWNSNFYNKQK